MDIHWQFSCYRPFVITDNPASIALVIWKAVIVITRASRINVIVYLPETTEGQFELEKRISQIHADAVVKGISGLDCTTEQKLRLFDSILKEAELSCTDSEPER